jgi:hypothetical protein
MKELVYWIKSLLHPSYWVMMNPYSKAWDHELRRLMMDHKFIICSQYTAEIGGVSVWIENHPYSSFCPDSLISVRPSRRTIMMAREKLCHDVFNGLGRKSSLKIVKV